MIVPKL